MTWRLECLFSVMGRRNPLRWWMWFDYILKLVTPKILAFSLWYKCVCGDRLGVVNHSTFFIHTSHSSPAAINDSISAYIPPPVQKDNSCSLFLTRPNTTRVLLVLCLFFVQGGCVRYYMVKSRRRYFSVFDALDLFLCSLHPPQCTSYQFG